MSNFLNKIPVSPIISFGNPSVPNGSTIGTNFSILQTGGYMEVYSLSGLTYTIPLATTGIIEFSGNSIPIQFTKGSGSAFSPDVLTLNSDNISSGRRKLGMLAYVYETNKIYQFRIDNYDTLWNNATGATTGPGGPTVVISDFGTTVKNNTLEGQAFINAWTASTISGIGGYNDTNASWRVLSTGGNSGGGTSITGGTFDNNTDTLTLNNSTGGTITITGFTDYYTTGFTFNPASYDLTIKRNDGLPDLSVNLSILSSDVTITGGTYNSSTGTATFTNNTGGTFNVTGFLTGFTDIYVTGGTFNSNNQTLTLTRNDNANINVSGFTDVFVTGGTYSDSTIIFTNNSGGTFNVTGITSSGGGTFTGGTVTGATIFTNGLTANTISATTYQNLPTDIRVTGGTKTGNNVVFTNNTGGTFTITGFTDTFVTGATYSNNTFTYINNTGGTFSVLFNTMTGLTATTISATTYQNLPTDIRVTGGTYSASTGITTFRNNTGGTFTVTGYFTPSNDIYVTGGTIGNGPNTSNNKITLNRSDGNNVTLNTLVDIVNLTKSDMDTIISTRNVIRGKTYKISGCDNSLYYNGTDRSEADVYTTIYLMGLEEDKLSESGIGVFYTPKYDIYEIFVDEKPFPNGTYVIWGGFVWLNKGGDDPTNSIDIFTLPEQYEKIFPFDDSDEYSKGFYNEQYDDIIYDYTNDRIIYRNEQNSNIVSTTYENITYWITEKGYYNPIRVFQWGHLVDSGNVGVIYNQQIINSYNENINYLGQYQKDFYFNNLSYQRDFFVEGDSYQSNFIFDNQSYQNDIKITNASYQSGITLNNGSYQNRIIIDESSYQNQITLNNNSYQDRIDIFGIEGDPEGDPANQSYFNFNNGSFHFDILLESVNGKPSIQNYFNFNNNSYQNNIDLSGGRQQNKLDFTNNSGQSSIVNTAQNSLIFDSSTQINRSSSLTQTNITIKNYDRDLTSVTNPEQDRYFIHDLPTDNTASVYIGKINNQLVQVTKPIDVFVTGGTYSGSTIIFRNNTGGTFNVTGITTSSAFTGGTVTGATSFTGGLTANTISATTYQNLPVSGVTGGTGISANTTNGLVTIVNTSPDQIVTISGGTGISTGGTYPNFVLTNTSPDQVVTISGGTNIEINGTYPNFGINFTGSTGASGDYLPLSGGTVSGGVIFTSGVTANTISATTYQNLPVSGVTNGTGISANTTNGLVTIVNTLPDQTVTITGGTNISVNGTYPNFGINFTGSTGASGDYLPLSGGTVTGGTIFTSGLTANTFSAGTYFNLPVSGVTGGTGISASTSDGLVTIVNTSPDQTVTITGGTNMEINGAYPNFGINFTGSTGASGDFLPLSGGTVTGATIFTNGLTANTISATTYQNLPQDIFVTGGTYTSGNAIFTNNSGGTFTVSGFPIGSGGGQIFYLNLSQSQNGNRLLSTTASTASEQSTGVTIGNGVTSTISSFQSQPLNTTLLPGGIWSFYLHSYKQNSNASFNIFVELYKITSGGTQTLLFTTDPTPVTTNSPNPSMQLTDGYFSGTSLSVSDGVVAVVKATNTGNQSHTITLFTEGSQHYSYAVSTIPTQQGLTCDTLSGCSIIQTIQTDVSNKLDKSGGTITGNLIINSGLTANTISATTITSPSISPYGLIVATSIGYQNIF
jgi:hypothetical protein